MNIQASHSTGVFDVEPGRAPVLSFQGVSKSFSHENRSTPAIETINLDIARGEFVAFLGPSGCGKTTLLNLAAGLIKPDNGAVLRDGEPLRGPNTRVGYLTQSDALLPWRTVIANVTLPLEIRRIPRVERQARAMAMLERVGLGAFARHLPGQLSGGMRKRAALARTLVYDPKTLLLDEPFSALDAQARLAMQRQLRELVDELGLTVLLVTHDLNEAIALADRIVVFSKRPARVLEDIDIRHDPSILRQRRTSLDGSLHDRLWSLLENELEAGALR